MAGCDAYLTKPLNEAQLAGILVKHDPISLMGRRAAETGTRAQAAGRYGFQQR